MEVFGIRSGFRGLLDNDIEPLTEKSLSGLLNLGGTILGLHVKNHLKSVCLPLPKTNRH